MRRLRENRVFILVVGSLMQLCYGPAVVWSVFQPYVIERFHVSSAQASQPFAILLAAFSFGNLVGGLMKGRSSARKLLFFASLIMGLSILLCAFVPADQFVWVPILFGVINGLSCGSAYNCVLSVIQEWFVDRKGLATGVLLGASGLFGFVINPIENWVLKHAGYEMAMLVLAAIILTITLSGSLLIQEAPRQKIVHRTPSYAVLKQRRFYAVALSMMLALPTYFLINPMMMTLSMKHGVSESLALMGVMASSLLNTAGRLIIPTLSDRSGRKPVLIVLLLANLVLSSGLLFAGGSMILVLCCLVCFVYGGIMGVYPVVNVDCFGMENAGTNYGLILLGYAAASLFCPYLLELVMQTPYQEALAFLIAAILSGAGLILVVGMHFQSSAAKVPLDQQQALSVKHA